MIEWINFLAYVFPVKKCELSVVVFVYVSFVSEVSIPDLLRL